MNRVPVSVVVLTLNEERNLPACLASFAGWATEVFIIDSGSTDRTREIAAAHAARIFENPFVSHAQQWNWALSNVPFACEWVLALDADHRVTPELAEELGHLLAASPGPAPEIAGFYVKRRQMFRGRWIRHGGYYPKYLLKLLRRGTAFSDENERLDHRFHVRGRTAKLENDIVEENRNEDDIDFFIQKHLRYAALQASEELDRRRGGVAWSVRPRLFGSIDERTLFLKSLWYRFPLYGRSILYFAYRYFLRLGFLDGKEGFIFHFLQAFWFRTLVDVKLEDLIDEKGVRPTA